MDQTSPTSPRPFRGATPQPHIPQPPTPQPTLRPTPQPTSQPIIPQPIMPQPIQPYQTAQPSQPRDTGSTKPSPKKKTPLIIGIIVSILALGGLVTFFVVQALAPKPTDLASAAILKFLKFDRPIAVNGTVNFSTDIEDSPFSALKITADSQNDLKNSLYASHFAINTTLQNTSTVDLKLDLLFKGQNLYLKAKNLPTAVNQIFGEDVSSMFATLAERFEDKWISVTLNEALDDFNPSGDASTSQCLIDIFQNSDPTAVQDFFAQHNFFTATKTAKTAKIPQKKSPVYQIAIDEQKFIDFVNALKTSSLVTDHPSCHTIADAVDRSEIESPLDDNTTIAIEFDNQSNITRILISSVQDEGVMELDVDLSYPSSVEVEAPQKFIPVEDIMKSFAPISNIPPLQS